MRLLFDVTRTLVHSRKKTPTGIDRVEHAYIRHLLDEPDPRHDPWFVVTTPYGQGALSPKQMRAIFSKVERLQQQASERGESSNFRELLSILGKPIGNDADTPVVLREQAEQQKDNVRSVVAGVTTGYRRFKRLMSDDEPAVYLHTSHLFLDRPECFQWLKRREILPIFLIHDLIPIEFPEFCTPGSAARHVIRMETMLEHAEGLITNSDFTRKSFLTYAGERPHPPIKVVHLANTIRDLPSPSDSPIPLGAPYFLHVGTIEGRKNIGHLLNVWRDLIARMGPKNTPRLVLVGRRGWECETVSSMLDRSRQLANHVIEASNVNDQELRRLMLNASGLITVSLSEGYGLTPVEAARIGTPVIASNIPAHREVLGDACIYVAPHDGEALIKAVTHLVGDASQRPGAHELPSLTWSEHVQTALQFAESRFQAKYAGNGVG